MPLKSTRTADVILSKRALISPTWVSLTERIMVPSRLLVRADELGGVDPDTGAHGRTDDDAPQVAAFGRGRLLPYERRDEGTRVVRQRLLGEAHLADARVDDAGLLDAVFDLAAFRLLDG